MLLETIFNRDFSIRIIMLKQRNNMSQQRLIIQLFCYRFLFTVICWIAWTASVKQAVMLAPI